MDRNEHLIATFVANLNSRQVKANSLYSKETSNEEYNSKDVISSVCSQVKAIQNADKMRKGRKNVLNMNKKNEFVPVHMMMTNQHPKTAEVNKFATQCMTDTELINIVENAEAFVNEAENISQEFDTTFCQNDLDYREKSKNIDKIYTGKNKDLVIYNNAIEPDHERSKNVTEHFHLEKDKVVLQKKFSIEKLEEDNFKIELNNQFVKERSKSPIFNTIFSPKLRSYHQSPLVYKLDSFERFESVALPIMNESLDFETARKAINAQIKQSKELFVHNHDEPVSHDRDKSLSPIFIVKKSEANNIKEDTITQVKNGMYVLEDSILFSSDEENDFENSVEIPLKCALETSFYKDDELIDVDFQAESNKFLRISSESYLKIQNVMDNSVDDLPISKLVEIIDSSNNNYAKENSSMECTNLENAKRSCDISKIADNVSRITSQDKNLSDIDNNLLKDKQSEDEHTNNVSHKEKKDSKALNSTQSNKIDHDKINLEEMNIDKHIIEEFVNNDMVENYNNIQKTVQTESKEVPVLLDDVSDNYRNFDLGPEQLVNAKALESVNNDMVENYNNIQKTVQTESKEVPVLLDDVSDNYRNFDLGPEQLVNAKALESPEASFKTLKAPNNSAFHNSILNTGFKTANNEKIKIHQKAKRKNIFEDMYLADLTDLSKNIDKGITDNVEDNKTCEQSLSKQFMDFATVNNNILHMSEKASAVHNLDIKGILSRTKGADTSSITTDMYLLKSNKLEGLDKYRVIDVINLNANRNDTNSDNLATAEFLKGFKTANNKTVKISEKALCESKKVFKDIDEKCDDKIDIPAEFKGFQTANNQSVVISKEVLATIKNDFQDVIENVNLDTNRSITNRDNLAADDFFQGFKTANNKTVKISDKALSESKQVFKDIDEKSDDNKEIPAKFKGFQTASKKPVEISKGALAKTKQKFEGFDNDNANNNYHEITSSGFQTASNQNVEISKEALLHIKKYFADVDFKQDALVKNIESEKNKDDAIIITNTNNVSKVVCNTDPNVDPDLDNLFNTEVIRDFEETFIEKEIHRNKKSGSPIFFAPKPKKSKPSKSVHKNSLKEYKNTSKQENIFKFNENYKKNKKFNLIDIIEMEKSNNTCPKIDDYILNFKFDTLLEFKFDGKRSDIDNDRWTTDKVKRQFMECIDKKIIPENWIENHMRLIIWKLISYEIIFPKTMAYICTVSNVLHQLRYRYDRELYNFERPVLRKILEKDIVSSKTMVLCVVGFYVDDLNVNSVANITKNIELLLTDGWYTVKACTDRMIDKLVTQGKISVGTKIFVHGAELMNCEQGVSPWEDTSAVRLKISGNSIKRAKWDTRLGFHGNGTILTQLSSVKIDGGKISKLRIFVTRVYPMLYVEKLKDGNTVTRSDRLEHVYQMKYENERQIEMEKIYEEAVKCSELDLEDSENQYIENLESGSQICKRMKRCINPTQFRASLTDTQLQLLQNHESRKRVKYIEDLERKVQDLVKKKGLNVHRNVIPVLKMRVIDVKNDIVSKALITLWRPNEYLVESIKEGIWMDVYNIEPTHMRLSELQISASWQSIFSKSKKQNDKLKTIQTFKRQAYPIKDLQNPTTRDYNEIDTAGFVFLIEPETKEFENSKQLYQNVYLADENKNIINVIFWGGVKKFGFENILDVGQIVCCVNLQIRHGNTRKCIQQFRAIEFTYFTKNCKIDALRRMTEDLEDKFKSLDKRQFIDDCVAVKNNFSVLKYGKTENVTPYRLNNSEFNVTKNRKFIDSPVTTDVKLNLTGLDFDSPFKQDTQDLSQKTMSRKRKVNEKIEKLRMYGEPPPLQPIHIQNKSNIINNSYKSPLASLASVKNLPENRPILIKRTEINPVNVKSPLKCVASVNKATESPITSVTSVKNVPENSPLSVNRTKMNPVKLDFCHDDNFLGDDLDASLPLSLDSDMINI